MTSSPTFQYATRLLGFLLAAVLLAACGITNPPVDEEPTPDTVTVTIQQGESADLFIDGELQLGATVETSGDATDAIDWESSDENVAVVSDTGLVTPAESAAVGQTVVITARSAFDPEEFDSIDVEIVAEPVPDGSLYVDATADPDGTGTAAAPFQTIRAAIAAAEDGQTIVIRGGEYAGSIIIDRPLTLRGEGDVTVTIDGSDAVADTEGAIEIGGISGVTISGIDFVVTAVADWSAVVAIYAASSAVTIEDATLTHAADLNGITVAGSTNVTLSDLVIEGTGGGSGAGVLLSGASADVDLLNVVTRGHEDYAGVALNPGSGMMSDITIDTASHFEEVNKMTGFFGGTGGLTGFDAPDFTHAIRNLHPVSGPGVYGGGDWWFFKYDRDIALRDSLFNFGEDVVYEGQADNLGISDEDVAGQDADNPAIGPWNGAASIVHELDASDQARLGDVIVVGEIMDDFYDYNFARSSNVQVALDQASALGIPTVEVLPGTYRGHLGPIDVPADVQVEAVGTGTATFEAYVATEDEVIVGAESNVSPAIEVVALGAPAP